MPQELTRSISKFASFPELFIQFNYPYPKMVFGCNLVLFMLNFFIVNLSLGCYLKLVINVSAIIVTKVVFTIS